jgi:hypothetical protein
MARKKSGAASENGGHPGRKPIGKQVNVRLPDDLIARLRALGEPQLLDLSGVIRMILARYLERAERELTPRSD